MLCVTFWHDINILDIKDFLTINTSILSSLSDCGRGETLGISIFLYTCHLCQLLPPYPTTTTLSQQLNSWPAPTTFEIYSVIDNSEYSWQWLVCWWLLGRLRYFNCIDTNREYLQAVVDIYRHHRAHNRTPYEAVTVMNCTQMSSHALPTSI